MQKQHTAAATTTQQHHTRHAAWLAAAAVTQAVWGLYSVATRYLQLHAAAPPFQLAAMLPILAWLPTVLICYGPQGWRALAGRARRRRRDKGSGGGDGRAAIADAEAGAAAAEAANGGGGPVKAAAAAVANDHHQQQQEQQREAPTTPTSKITWARWAKLQLLALAVGSLVALAALGLVCATLFVPAFIVQLVQIMVPLFTAVASRCLLRAPTPYMLWPSLAAGSAGSAMAVVGTWLDSRGRSGGGSSSNGGGAAAAGNLGAAPHAHVLAGVGISLAAAALFAAYFIALQATRRLLTTPQQLMASRHAAILIMLSLALVVEGTQWRWLAGLTGRGWAALLFASVIAFNLGSVGLQYCTRALGAASVAQLSCLRLVAAIAGSAVALHELPQNALTWAGCAVVVVVMALWVWLVARHERRKAAEQQQQQQQQQQPQQEQQQKDEGDVALAVGPR